MNSKYQKGVTEDKSMNLSEKEEIGKLETILPFVVENFKINLSSVNISTKSDEFWELLELSTFLLG